MNGVFEGGVWGAMKVSSGILDFSDYYDQIDKMKKDLNIAHEKFCDDFLKQLKKNVKLIYVKNQLRGKFKKRKLYKKRGKK